MRAQDIHASGARLRFADYIGLGVECELAVRLSRDLPPGPCDAGQASEAVGDMFAAIEIVENRYAPDFTSVGVPTLVADQMFHAACVIGTAARWRDLDLARIPGEIFRDGIRVDGGTGGDLMGHPLRALAWLAGSPEAAGFGGLRAGQVVMLGSVTPPVWLGGPCRITVHFTGMEPVELQFD
jgi:2-keto-4-pentenoate hydratase